MAESKPNRTTDESTSAVPKAVISRLSLYLRELQHLLRNDEETTNSARLGQLLGITDAQVRKDLAHFGQFGYPGIGYRCEELASRIKTILGTDREWPVALVGVGNLGQALLGYKGFNDQGFRISVAFDLAPSKVGSQIAGIPVFHLDRLPEIVSREKIQLAILAVPSDTAQSVADQLVAAGISGILNFAPVTITSSGDVAVVGVDLAIELEQLSFAVVKQADKN